MLTAPIPAYYNGVIDLTPFDPQYFQKVFPNSDRRGTDMLCQNCNLMKFSIHLYTNVNGNQQQVDLCQNCYKIMNSTQRTPLINSIKLRFQLSFDDFFSDLTSRSSNGDLPNTSPTQGCVI